MDLIPHRYEHNPMLVLVENYILDSIGRLEPEKSARLAEMVPRILSQAGAPKTGAAPWRAILERHLDLPPDTPATLRTLWQQRQTEADLKQEDLTPEEFARDQADQLFGDLGH
jgi:hypothetical protein